MLTEQEYVEQLRQSGHRIHEHDGVYWEQTYPFFCRPALFFRAFDPGTARPAAFKSLLGYSHEIEDANKATHFRTFLVLTRDVLNDYSIPNLLPKKRSQVRQALRNCEVKLITKLDEDLLERIRQINIAQAIRQEKGFGAETPVDRYVKELEQWKKQIRNEFRLAGREWWGAYVDGVLVAYIKTYQIDSTRIIEQTKTDSQYAQQKPMDALYYTVIETAAKELSCTRILNGTPLHPSLTLYKEQFLFKEVTYPYFSSNYKLTQTIKKLLGKS